jgi:hypothetical protein
MCLQWGRNWVFISQKTTIFTVIAVKPPNLTRPILFVRYFLLMKASLPGYANDYIPLSPDHSGYLYLTACQVNSVPGLHEPNHMRQGIQKNQSTSGHEKSITCTTRPHVLCDWKQSLGNCGCGIKQGIGRSINNLPPHLSSSFVLFAWFWNAECDVYSLSSSSSSSPFSNPNPNSRLPVLMR